MKSYKIKIEEVFYTITEVDAQNKKEALQIVQDQLDSGEVGTTDLTSEGIYTEVIDQYELSN